VIELALLNDFVFKFSFENKNQKQKGCKTLLKLTIFSLLGMFQANDSSVIEISSRNDRYDEILGDYL